jgi:chromosome segregation ATPase
MKKVRKTKAEKKEFLKKEIRKFTKDLRVADCECAMLERKVAEWQKKLHKAEVAWDKIDNKICNLEDKLFYLEEGL